MLKKYYCVVYITAPKGPQAKKIATRLVKERLVACVNIVPSVQSYYWWKNKIEMSGESLLIAKTRRSRMTRLKSLVKKIHPYDVPEIIAMPIADGNRPYLSWLHRETKTK